MKKIPDYRLDEGEKITVDTEATRSTMLPLPDFPYRSDTGRRTHNPRTERRLEVRSDGERPKCRRPHRRLEAGRVRSIALRISVREQGV